MNNLCLGFLRHRSTSTQHFRDPQWLLNRARENPPENPTPIISDFSSWVFNLCHENSISYRQQRGALEHGRSGERLIADRRLWRNRLKPFSAPNNEWELDYQDPLDDSREYFECAKLRFNGRPMVGRPDVVLTNRRDRSVMIIERKVSRSWVPEHGWPNLQAQLWCYSFLKPWRKADSMFLVGEVWKYIHVEGLVQSRTFPRWMSNDTNLQNLNRELFRLYGGEIIGD